MIRRHPTLKDRYVIDFDLDYKHEHDYQIHIARSDDEHPNTGITLQALNHIASSVDLMLTKLRFAISYQDVQISYEKPGPEECVHESDNLMHMFSQGSAQCYQKLKCKYCGEYYKTLDGKECEHEPGNELWVNPGNCTWFLDSNRHPAYLPRFSKCKKCGEFYR